MPIVIVKMLNGSGNSDIQNYLALIVFSRQTADAMIENYQSILVNMIEAAQEAETFIQGLRRLRRRSRQHRHRRALNN